MNKIEYGTEFLDQLRDSVHDLYDENKELKKEIERLNNIINKAIEWCESCYVDITNAIGEKRKMISSENIIEILKGEDNDI